MEVDEAAVPSSNPRRCFCGLAKNPSRADDRRGISPSSRICLAKWRDKDPAESLRRRCSFANSAMLGASRSISGSIILLTDLTRPDGLLILLIFDGRMARDLREGRASIRGLDKARDRGLPRGINL